MGVHTQKKKGGQFNAFGRGGIIYLSQEGMRPSEIAKRVKKTNGKLGKVDSVRKTIRKFKRTKGKWDGERKPGSGPPCKLTEKEKADIVKLVFAKRGKAVVTTRYVQQCIPALRRVGRWCISNALHEAGLAWLRRRNKRKLSLKHRQARRKFARWVLTQPSDMWRKVAYVDGTTYYLARTDAEADDKERLQLGKFVWRDAAGKDGIFIDCVGPSLYAAKQGRPVKVWGLLLNGHICIHILPTAEKGVGTAHMNGPRYREMITKFGRKWISECFPNQVPKHVRLVQDHERCLWQDASLACLKNHGFDVLENYPVNSPDLNAIETVWNMIRQELFASSPTSVESREDFIHRLRAAVRTVNKNRDGLMRLCTKMPEKVRAVQKLQGARTAW